MSLTAVTGAEKNPKKHAHEDIGKSIGRFGYVEPVVLDERTQRLVAGHGRVQALRAAKVNGEQPPQGVEVGEKGEWLVPVLRGWSSRSDAEAQAYLVASNNLATKGGWEDGELVAMLQELEAQAALDGTGYDADDIANLIDSLTDEKKDEADDKKEKKNRMGDLFQVLVEVADEAGQADLIQKLEREGFKCRPLIF